MISIMITVNQTQMRSNGEPLESKPNQNVTAGSYSTYTEYVLLVSTGPLRRTTHMPFPHVAEMNNVQSLASLLYRAI